MSILKEKKELLESFVESVAGDEPQSTNNKTILEKDVSELMLSDLETKLLEILQEAKKTMRHSKRHVLTTTDIDSAFSKLTIKVSGKAPIIVYPAILALSCILFNNQQSHPTLKCKFVGDLWLSIISALCLLETKLTE